MPKISILVGCVAVILLLVPFGWFEHGQGDFGGDSSRLYFVDPHAWIDNFGLSPLNISDFGNHNPNYFLLPFLSLLVVLHKLTGNNPSVVLALFNGGLLATAFLATYAFIRDFIDTHASRRFTRPAALIGGLFFVFSPLITFSWQKTLYHFHQIAVYPLLAWLLLRYLKTGQKMYLAGSLLLTVIFSVNFSAYAAPVLLAFWPFMLLLLCSYALHIKQTRRWLVGGLLFVIFFIGLHAWHLLPQVATIINPTSGLHQNIFTTTGKIDRGLGYFEGVRPMVRLLYNLAGFPQYYLYLNVNSSAEFLELLWHYNIRLLPLFVIFPLLIVGGLLLRPARDQFEQRMFLTVASLWLVIAFLMTANLFGNFGPRLYAALFSLPGFSMFRSFYGVFAIVFIFFFSLLLSYSVRSISAYVRWPHPAAALTTALALLLTYGAWPLLAGHIVNLTMPDTRGIALANHFAGDFLRAVHAVRADPSDAKLVTMPLTYFNYQIISGEHGGAYVGPSPVAILAGKNTFSGLANFTHRGSEIYSVDFVLQLLQEKNATALNRLFALLNVEYIFFNADPTAYHTGFTGWPYSSAIWSAFPTSDSIATFIADLGYEPKSTYGFYTLYHNPKAFLPRLYVPRTVVKFLYSAQVKQRLLAAPEYDLYTAFYPDIPATQMIPSALLTPPLLDVQRHHSTRYEVTVRDARSSFPLVFSQDFHSGWRIFPVSRSSPPPGKFITTALAVPEQYHLQANEYANSWWVDVGYIKQHYPDAVTTNDDGSVDIHLWLEFVPHHMFYRGLAVSTLTAITGLLMLSLPLWRKHKVTDHYVPG